jgi:multidrug efflux pump subunit AcrA (membrane-fusion protein)
MNRKIIATVTIVLMVLFGFVMYNWLSTFKKPPRKTPPPQLNRYVKASPVHYTALPGIIETTCRLKTFNEITISSEVGGRLTDGVHLFKAGQAFKQGEIMARVINEEFTYQLKAKKSKFLQSIAAILPDIKVDFPDAYPKWLSFFESVDINQELPAIPNTETSKEKIFMASRNVLNDYFSIKSDEVRLAKHTLYAPFDGSLKEVNLQVGSVLNPGTRLATFTRSDLYELEVPVQVEDIKLLKIGTTAEIYNESNQSWSGQVVRIGKVINHSTHTVIVYVSVKNTQQYPLYDGMYLRVKFQGQIMENVMEMPRSAVYNGNEVYILKDGSLVKTPITIQKLNKETLYFNGLEPGVEVVTESITGITGNAKFEAIPEDHNNH